jgi:hypothetical protein
VILGPYFLGVALSRPQVRYPLYEKGWARRIQATKAMGRAEEVDRLQRMLEAYSHMKSSAGAAKANAPLALLSAGMIEYEEYLPLEAERNESALQGTSFPSNAV